MLQPPLPIGERVEGKCCSCRILCQVLKNW